MNHVSGTLDGQKWTRTSKQAARNAYNQGEEVLICAVNLSPFSGVYTAGNRLSRQNHPLLTFDAILRNYARVCNSNRTGRYAAFYVKAKGGKE